MRPSETLPAFCHEFVRPKDKQQIWVRHVLDHGYVKYVDHKNKVARFFSKLGLKVPKELAA